MDFVLSNAKLGFPGGSVVKNPPATTEDEGDMGSIPGTGRCPGRGNDSSSQYSCLENAHGQRSLAGCRPWGRKEQDMTEHAQHDAKLVSMQASFPSAARLGEAELSLLGFWDFAYRCVAPV